ncbi:MAG TPA: VWA domain-containing protein [Thermoanaerobaculia bacterium]|nr:VWA domain-containing protein [Thermoanaerobaculia bacterium]
MKSRLCALLLAVPLTLFAQSKFGEKIEVKLIEIDAVVTDAKGNRVYGLTAGDFLLFEGRKQQEISNFSEYRSPEAKVNAGSEAKAAVIPRREPHSIMVLIDALPRRRFIRDRALKDLEQVLGRTLQTGDRASVIAWASGYERPVTVQEPTNDLALIHQAIRRIAGTVTAAEQVNLGDTTGTETFFKEAESVGGENGIGADAATQNQFTQRVGAQQDIMLLRRKCRSMQRLISTLAAQPGKKSFIYVSQTFMMPDEGGDGASSGARAQGLEIIERLVKQANASSVTVYAVRPYLYSPDDDDTVKSVDTIDSLDATRNKGFRGHNLSTEALQQLTLPTGGAFGTGPDSVAKVGAAIIEDLESYYSLAYRARSDGGDRERKITVRTKNPAYTVRSRHAFIEKSNETIARDSLIDRLFSNEGANDLAFDVAEKPVQRIGRNRWLLPIELRIPTSQLQYVDDAANVDNRGQRVAHVKILIAAAFGVSEITPVTDQTLRIVAREDDRGGYITYETKILGDSRGSKVSIGVFDTASGLAGYRTIDNRQRFP